jgi:hypothetical protein
MSTRLLTVLLLAVSFAILPVVATALEEPEFTVIGTYDEFELRHYPPYLVAEVDVPGGFDDGGNRAFRILAGYIFGDNRSAEKMKMTAPVETSPAGGSEKMAMTAPVTATDTAEGMTTFAFIMERKYTADTLPVPNDERIRIREMPERTMAVRRYSGRWTQSRYRDNLDALNAALADARLTPIGKPVLARYNSPFSLPLFRRNEVMIEVVPPDH